MAPAALGYAAVAARSPRHRTAPRRAASRAGRRGHHSFGAYVLVLAALARASAASVAAVRETSVVIATAAAAPFLQERVGLAPAARARSSWSRGVALVSLG